MNSIDYIIISKPDYIKFDCPYCKEEDLEVPFCEVNYKTEYWGDGALVTCPHCYNEVELDNYEYD